MSTSESGDSCLDSPTTSCGSAGTTQWRPNLKNGLAVKNSGPYIEIVEEPQGHARFRYCTEGDHGFLHGATSTIEHLTYPAVRLVNYDGEAHIRCELYQYDKEEKHPHLLKYDRQEISHIDFLVPCRESYTVYYDKLSFVHKSTSVVTQEEQDKYRRLHPKATEKQVKKESKKIVKGINFNKLRLRFSAHDVETDDEICHVYSRPIFNAKNADTNELQIVGVSHLVGHPCDKIMLLVNKIKKSKVKVRFVDPKAACGEWSAYAYINLVHHQVAIVCRVPEYKERDLGSDVQVVIELERETDGEKSNRVPFTYKGQRHHALRAKKRTSPRALTSLCQMGVADNSDQNTIVSAAKIKKSSDENFANGLQVCEVPVSFECWTPKVDDTVQTPHSPQAFRDAIHDYQRIDSSNPSSTSNSDSGLGVEQAQDLSNSIDWDALLSDLRTQPIPISEEVHITNEIPNNLEEEAETVMMNNNNPPLSVTAAVAPPAVVRPNLNHQYDDEGFIQFCRHFNPLEFMGSDESMDYDPFQCDGLIPDSPQIKLCSFSDNDTANINIIRLMKSEDTAERGKITLGEILVADKMKQLVKDVIAIINRKGSKIDMQTKLEQLYDLDLPSGDTFLHVAMNRAVTFLFANVLNAMNMGHLLNKANDLKQTVLHLAVLNKWPDVANMLVSKGCDPMLADIDGNNAIHQAVTSFPSLEALLKATAAYKVPYDINATNNEKQTPLHVAAINDCESSLRLLLESGADIRARDHSGRTALHLAACHDRAKILGVLLDYMDSDDVDATDYRGQTALQIACDSDVREHTLPIVLLLLEARADPTKCDGNSISALKLARRHPEMFEVIQRHMASVEDSDDEYFTGDEGESEDEYCITSMLHAIKINKAK